MTDRVGLPAGVAHVVPQRACEAVRAARVRAQRCAGRTRLSEHPTAHR